MIGCPPRGFVAGLQIPVGRIGTDGEDVVHGGGGGSGELETVVVRARSGGEVRFDQAGEKGVGTTAGKGPPGAVVTVVYYRGAIRSVTWALMLTRLSS